jgi:hypothetical protein
MGNVPSSAPTKKLKVLNEEFNDFSANISSRISMEATQAIAVNQTQNIVINNSTFKGCDVGVSQKAQVTAKQVAVFKATLSNPKQVVKQIAEGPNSMFGQAMKSTSPVMKDFLANARQSMGTGDNVELQKKLTNIVRINVNQESIMRATQKVAVNQTQNVFLDGSICEGGKITIDQSAVVDAFQNVIFTVMNDSVMSDPNMRRAVRQFNGEYNPNELDNELDKGVKLPESCFSQGKDNAMPTCPPCEDCGACPQPPPCKVSCPSCQDYILNANIFYGFFGVMFFMFLIVMLSKSEGKKMVLILFILSIILFIYIRKTNNKPVEEAPVEEVPVEEAPVEEVPVEEVPVEEVPVEEAPVE